MADQGTHRRRRIQYVATFCVALSSLCVGALSAWPTPVLPKYTNNETDVQINDHQQAWLNAVNVLGFSVGSLVTGYTADKFGRRASILASAVPIGTATMIAVFAVQPWLLYITRFLWGCGSGMIVSIGAMYLGEIADKEVRGTLMVVTKVFFNLGVLLMIAVGPFVSYSTINICLLVLPASYFVACWWIPESPHYYLKDGRIDIARKTIKRLRGHSDPLVLEEEVQTLKKHVSSEMSRSSSRRELLTGMAYRRAIIVAAGLKAIQTMMGSVTITQYLGRIMEESEASISKETVYIVFGVVRFIVAVTSMIFVDRIGRRPLLFYSCLTYAISLTFVGVYFYLKEVAEISSETLEKFDFIVFGGILISTIVATFGIFTVVFIIQGEIFPLNVKAIAISSLNIFAGFLGFSVAHIYQLIKDVSGLCGVFLMFSCVTYFGAAFVYYLLPETRGKSLHEILIEIQGKYYTEEIPRQVMNGEKNDELGGVELELMINDKEKKEEVTKC